MIRPIDITLNAAHPELPLVEATTFTDAPSSVFIRGVPKSVGNWSITAVNVSVTYPDNTTTTRAAVESAEGVWVATIPGTATSGRTPAGFRITADGIDENGATVTGYVLGFADFAVFSLIPLPTPDAPFYYLRYFESVPASPHKGDVCYMDGVLKWYDGSAWQPIAGAPVVAPSTDPEDAGKSADAYATGTALVGKASKAEVDPLLFAQYYPDASVKSAAEFTQGIKYTFDTTNHTATVKPFCNAGDSDNDNSSLSGRVVIPPFVDAQGNGYISDDGTRYRVVGVSGGESIGDSPNLSAIIAPSTVTTIGDVAFFGCSSLTTVSLPVATTIGIVAFLGCSSLTTVSLPVATTIGNYAFLGCSSLTTVSLPVATTIGNYAFNSCSSLTTVSLPAATSIGVGAFDYCFSLTSVSLPAATTIEYSAFSSCLSLASVDFGDTSRASVPLLGGNAFISVPTDCKIIVPYTQYDAWIAAENWRDLPQEFVRHAEKADKPATFTTGNLAEFDANGNPTDSGVKASDKLASTSAAPAFSSNSSTQYAVGAHVTYNGKLYACTTATTGGTWDSACWHIAELPKLPVIRAIGNLVSFGLHSTLTDSGIARADVAVKGDLPYAISESIPLTVTSGAASTTLDDRTHNVRTVAAPGSGNTTTITATLPPIVAGKSRDMFLNLTVGTQASDAGDISLSIVEPSGATVQIDIGSVEDIGVGENEIMISENALPTTSGNTTTTHWLVTVRHEDFAS